LSEDDIAMRLKNKVAVIIGGANGIGRAIAIRFADEGASVAVNDIDDAAGQVLESEIGRLGGTSFYVHGDAASESDVSALMTAVKDKFGGLDILVNNVVARETALAANDWDSLTEVSLKSYWISMKAAFPLMQHAGASVVNVSSVNALMGFGKDHLYSSMKAAIIGLSRSMVGEFSPHGIRINCICPGTIVTERWKTRFEQNPELEARLSKLYPIGRLGNPEDIANAALFLASDDASFITGAVLTVDGGLTAANTGFAK
jgi:NAD(P)-dependent dehydrogenase (short-subunit alcohol dehydrogenase family)